MPLFRRPARRHRPALAADVARVEVAEPRTMLSGNVVAELLPDGTLRLRGDGEANDLTVRIESHQITFDSNSRTTVNGLRADRATIALGSVVGRTHPLVFQLGAEARLSSHGSLTVLPFRESVQGVDARLGEGDDRLLVEDRRETLVFLSFDRQPPVPVTASRLVAATQLRGDITIHGGGGDDDLRVSDSVVAGRVRLVGGLGDDVVQLDGVTAGRVQLEGGRGGDALVLDDVTAVERLRAYGGRGDDTVVGRRLAVEDAADLPRLYGEAGEDDVGAEDLGGRVIARQNAGLAPPVVSDGVRPEDREALDRLFEEAERAAGRDLFGGDAISLPGAGFPIGFEAFDRSQFTATESGLLYRVVGAGRPGPAARAAAIETDVQRVDAGDGRVVSDSFRTAASNLPAAGTPLGVEIEAILRTAGLYARVQFLVPGDLRGEAGGLFAGVGGPAFLNVQVTGVRR